MISLLIGDVAERTGLTPPTIRYYESIGLLARPVRSATGYRRYPESTVAELQFIRKAQERRRDFTVDWVHLKLNDQAQRTVLCKDPFRSHDERVERLIESM